MTRQGKIAIVLLGVVSVLAVAAAGGAVILQRQERTLRLAKERELVLVKEENEGLQQQLQQIRQAKEQLETDMDRVKDQLKQTTDQLAQEVEAKAQLAKSVDERQREIDRVGKDLEQARSERTSLTEQIATLKQGQDSLHAQLGELQQAKHDLEAKVLELSEQPTVELDKVVVAPPSGSSPAGESSPGSATQGQVVVVNREFDFVVVSLGKKQGLTVGQEFQIVRGQQVLGRVKVEKVYDELSAAAILPESNKDAIREGDLVKAI